MLKNKIVSDFYSKDIEIEIPSLTKYCEWRNCEAKGEYKAPTSRDKLRVFKWFCLRHVKLYNKGWDYFKGRTTDQIYKEVSNDATWHRPTWIRVKRNKFHDMHSLFSMEKDFSKFTNISYLSKTETHQVLDSLKILNMSMPNNISDLKNQYKLMVKKFHPDVSKEDTEETIIKLNEAYSILLKLLKF